MKRDGGLFQKIVKFENLLLAYRKARRGKRDRAGVARFGYHLEREILLLQRELEEGTYQPGALFHFWIDDPKRRLISASPFRDRVVQHALCNVIEPLLDRRFIAHSYSCRKGKGTHAAVRQYRRWSREYRYVLKCDIQKFFPSIDIDILRELIQRKIKCQPTLILIERILQNTGGEKTPLLYFPGDDLFTPLERRHGLPIGNLTSQLFANLYLDALDQYVTHVLGYGKYLRYTDDLLVLGDNKKELWLLREQIGEFLGSELRLRLHDKKSQIYRTQDGLTFLGYRIWPHRIRVKAQSVRRIRRRFKKIQQGYATGEMSLERVKCSIQGWLGHVRHAQSRGLRGQILGNLVLCRGRE